MTSLDELIDGPAVKAPGAWRRKGENGPPIVTDPNGEAVQSGARRGLPRMHTYSRPSGFGHQVENTFNLAKWQQRNGVIGMHLEPSLLDEMAALWEQPDHDDREWKTAVDGVYTKAAKAAGAMLAAERGTHAHGLTEDSDLGRSIVSRLVNGDDLGLGAPLQQAIVDVWEALIDAYFEVLAVEFACVYDRWRVAGTGDRIVRTKINLTFTVGRIRVTIPAGTVMVLDVKTGGLKLDRNGVPTYWHSYAVQVAAYANGVPYDVDTEQRGEWPWEVSTEHAVIAHIDIAGALDTGVVTAQLFYVDIVAGHAAGELVCQAKAWQKRRDLFSNEGTYSAVLTVPTPEPEPDLRPGIVARARALVDAGHGDLLAARWPTGMPGLRTEHPHTADELRAIAAAVRTVEDTVGTPTGFTAADMVPQPPMPSPLCRRMSGAGLPAPIYEGDAIAAYVYDELKARLATLDPEDVARLEQVATQAAETGLPISLAQRRSTRRYLIVTALATWSEAGWDADIMRDVLATVLDSEMPRHPTTPLGAAVGALTIDEAIRLADMGRAVVDGAAITHDGDRFVVTNQHKEK